MRRHPSFSCPLRLGLAAAACALALAAGPARAADAPVFAVPGYEVGGDPPLDAGEAARVLAPFVRPDATLETLQQAAAALEARLRERGWGLWRVVLPPQAVGDAVRLEAVPLRLSRVEVEFEGDGPAQGERDEAAAAVLASLPALAAGATPNLHRLAVQLAIANERPSRQLQVALREDDGPERIAATVRVRQARPWRLALGLSNAGQPATGRDRLTLAAAHDDLFGTGQQAVAAYTTSAQRPGALHQWGLSWRLPLPSAAGVLALSAQQADVAGDFGAFTSAGRGSAWGLRYTAHLAPRGGERRYLLAGLDERRLSVARIDGADLPGQSPRRSRPLSLGYGERGFASDGAPAWQWQAEAVANTAWSGDGGLDALRSEDARITTARWTALRGQGALSRPLAGGELALRAQGQYSGQALIAAEQFALGSANLRGAGQERAIAGDSGLAASLEWRTRPLAPGLRLLGFMDLGWLAHSGPAGAARPSSDIMASLGAGGRLQAGPLAASLDWGRIVRGSWVDPAAHPSAPRRGDTRLHLTITLQY